MTAWLMEALVASALLMLLVLVARGAVRRVFGPQVAYALWALPVLRLVMPPLPESWREQAVMPISRASEVATVFIAPAAEPVATMAAAAPVATAPLPWGLIVAGLWAAGAGAFFVYHFLRHRSFCRGLLRSARTIDEVGGVQVVETPAAAGPLAFGLEIAGIGRRFVAFPDDFADRYDADERELALAHELGHHARGDLFANWVALAVLAVHWFNPLAWRAFRAFRADQELANDARVLAGRSRADRHIYACAIVKAAHGGAVAATCHLHTISDLKGRLRMLSITRLSRTRLVAGATAVAGLVATGLVVTASGTQAAAAITAKVEDATGVQIAAPAVPEVPAAPAAPATSASLAKLVAVEPRGSHKRMRVIVKGDGESKVYEGAEAARYLKDHPLPSLPPMPPLAPTPPAAARAAAAAGAAMSTTVTVNDGQMVMVTSDDCQPLKGPSVVHRERSGRREMIVCRNRIEAIAGKARADAARAYTGTEERLRMAERAAAIADRQATNADRMAEHRLAMADHQAAMAQNTAAQARRMGLAQGLAGIATARRSIEANRNLSDDQRRHALAGLDDAAKNLREDMND